MYCTDITGKIIRKREEAQAMTAIQKFIEANYECAPHFIYEPEGNDKAPDFSCEYKDEKVLIEVRTTAGGYLIAPAASDVIPATQQILGTKNLQEKIKQNIKQENLIKEGDTLIVTILSHLPKEKRSQLCTKITAMLKEVYTTLNNTASHSTYCKIKWPNCSDSKVEFYGNPPDFFHKTTTMLDFKILLTSYYDGTSIYEPIKFIDAQALSSPIPTLQNSLPSQAQYILNTSIPEKANKLAHLEGHKWLALVNDHPLLDFNTYQEVYWQMLEKNKNFREAAHCFKKIFLVYDDDHVQEIKSR